MIIVILFKSVILKTETIALNVALIVALSALYVCKCSGRDSDPLVDTGQFGKVDRRIYSCLIGFELK